MAERVVFTNGVYDLFHVGHLRFLKEAKTMGTSLIVGINSDESVRRIKGRGRPIIPVKQRVEIVQSLWFVDGIVVFEEDDPLKLIKKIKPNVLVKGESWEEKDIIGGDFVKSIGGEIIRIPLVKDVSTTRIIEAIISENAL